MNHARAVLAFIARCAGADRNELWAVILGYRILMLVIFMLWDASFGWRWEGFPIGVATSGYLLVLFLPVLVRAIRSRWGRMRGVEQQSS